MLGPDYLVGYPRKVRGMIRRLPEIILVDLAPSGTGWDIWEKYIDGFVPDARQRLSAYRFSKVRTILVVPPLPEVTRRRKARFVSLCKQIANESLCDFINLDDGPTDAVQTLYLALFQANRNPGTWRVLSATSEQSDEGPAKNAIDNNAETYWHTRYDPNPTKVPHELVVDLGKSETLTGFSYLPRQDGGVNGRVKDFEIYLSDDPKKWSKPAAQGTLQNTMQEQKILFAHAAKGRYLRFVALSEVNGNIWTSMAELGIMRSGKSK